VADHLSQTDFERYRDRRLDVRELLRVDSHLMHCDQCEHALRLLSGGSTAARVLTAIERAGAHLTYEQMEAYVDDKLSPIGRANVEAHASACAPCAKELADMRGFAPELARPVARPADPVLSPLARLTRWIGGGSASARFGGAGMRAAVAAMFLAVGVILLAPPRENLPGSDMALVIDRNVAVIDSEAPPFTPGQFDQQAFARLGSSSPDVLTAFRSGKDAAVAEALETRARSGDAVAQSALALLYLGGKGVAHNAQAAEHLLKQAAEQGSASAAHNLGVLYGRGLLGTTDEAEAARWYERARQLAGAKR
jgi:Putative zinc-finger/Sel1 repeat